ncbi:MAG: GNAT family protein [Pseudomonadota bacterium]|nr:GNAT family protein [Pseudomonadota bacterium]
MGFMLKTRNLILRDFSIDDLNGYVAFTQDEKYQRFYSESDCSLEKSRELVESFVEQSLESPRTKYQLAITEKGKQEIIGTCGLRLEAEGQASIGCGVAREQQCSGYAEEAMSMLVHFGFQELEVHRVYAETIEENRAAINLCKKFGMRVEAKFIEHRYFKGRWWNTVLLALLKSEWSRNMSKNCV